MPDWQEVDLFGIRPPSVKSCLQRGGLILIGYHRFEFAWVSENSFIIPILFVLFYVGTWVANSVNLWSELHQLGQIRARV
jgi:hypothetical protein